MRRTEFHPGAGHLPVGVGVIISVAAQVKVLLCSLILSHPKLIFSQPQIGIVEIVVDIQHLLPVARSFLIIISGLCIQTSVDQPAVCGRCKDFNGLVNSIHYQNLVIHKAESHRRAEQPFTVAGSAQLIHQITVRAVDKNPGIIGVHNRKSAVIRHSDGI